MVSYGGVNLDPRWLPTLAAASAPPPPPAASGGNPLWAGLKSGGLGLAKDLVDTVNTVGTAAGVEEPNSFGNQLSRYLGSTIESNSRPDLAGNPFGQGFGHALSSIAYQGAQAVPTIFGLLAAPEVEGPAALANIGLNGKRLGMLATALPFAPGQSFGAAQERPGGATREDAFKALALSPVVAGLNTLVPDAITEGIGGKFATDAIARMGGGLAAKIGVGGAIGAAAGAVQGGVSTAVEQGAFRPDLTPQERMANIVDSVVSGSAVGGLFGGAFGSLRPLKHADPAELANNPDALGSEIDKIINPQLALPAPTIAVDSAGRAGNPAELLKEPITPPPAEPPAQQALPAPDQASGPVVGEGYGAPPLAVDAAGRVGDPGQLVGTPVDPTPIAPREPLAPALVPDDTSRSFRNFTDAELIAAQHALANKHEAGGLNDHQRVVADAVHQELEFRNRVNNSASATGVDPAAVEAVQRGLKQSGGASEIPAAPVSTTLDISSIKRVPQSVKDALAAAKSPDEALTIAHAEVIESAKGGKWREELGKKAGLLDDEGKPTPLAAEVSAQQSAPEPAAPANVEGGDVAAAPSRVDIFNALGAKFDEKGNALGPRDETDAAYAAREKAAQDAGLLNHLKQLTPLGEQTAREAIPAEEVYQGGLERHFTGSQLTDFERGVRSLAGETAPEGADAKAFEAGQKWAVPKMTEARSVNQAVAEIGKDTTVEKPAYNEPLSYDQKRVQGLNGRIDAMFDGTTTHPTEVAQLKAMVADPKVPAQDIIKAMRHVEAGGSLFNQPASVRPDFVGERPEGTVGALALKIQQRAAYTGDRFAPGEKAERTQQDAAAIQQYKIKKATLADITAARANGDITENQARKAMHQAITGNIDEARSLLPDVKGLTFERTGDGAAGVDAKTAQTTVDKITGSWKGDSNVVVHDTVGDVPADLRSQLSSDGTKGFYDTATKTMHVIAGNHVDAADVTATVYHELLGHKGLQSAFGAKLDSLLGNVYKTNKEIRESANQYLETTGKWADLDAATRGSYATQEILAHASELGLAKSSGWQKIVAGVRDFGRKLGLVKNYSNEDVQAILARAHDTTANGIGQESVNTGAPQINERVGKIIPDVTGKVDEMLDKIEPTTRARKAFLPWMAENSVAKTWGKLFDTATPDGVANGLLDRIRFNDMRNPLANHLAAQPNDVQDRIATLKGSKLPADRKAFESTNELMKIDGINPFRTFEQQSAEIQADPRNRAEVDKARSLVRSLQATGHIDLYSDMRNSSDIGRLRQLDNMLHKEVNRSPLTAGQIPAFAEHPLIEYMDHATSADKVAATKTDTTPGLRQYTVDGLNQRLAALDAFTKAQQAIADHPTTEDATKTKLAREISGLDKTAAEIRAKMKAVDDTPNFSFGRDGDYFVSMKLRTDDKGNALPADMRAMAEALKDYGKVVPLNSTSDHVFMRVKSQTAQNSLMQLAAKLQEEGIIRQSVPDDAALVAGKRGDPTLSANVIPQFVSKYIASIESNSSLSDSAKAILIKEARATALDMLPDHSNAAFNVKRAGIPGFDDDMYSSWLTRIKAANDALVSQAISPKIGDSYKAMEASLDANQRANAKTMPLEARYAQRDVLDELYKKDYNRPAYEATPFVDRLRRVANFWGLGGTIAYPIIQLTQLGMVALPKFGAKYGFVKSAKAMSAVTPQAMKVMKAVLQDGWNVSASRATNAGITLKALQRAGVSARESEYLMHLVNSGQLDVGGMAHILSSAANGSSDGAFNKTMQFSSAMGYYAETLSRVVTALAHLKLNPELSARDAAVGGTAMLKDSMFDFHMDAQGRAFGKDGFAGSKTPLLTQFMTYQSQLIQRIYLEAHDALKGETPQQRSEARKFLLQHAAMSAAFAGTMGMPFATAFAAAYDKLKDLVDSDGEPSDIRSAYRGYLANMFGKDAGEVIAKGGFRTLGVDLTNRIGEQDLLPFSKFIADRRGFKDKIKDLEARSFGAPASMMSNAIVGGEKLSNGDIMGGLSAMLPAALANPTKAYRMTQDGYVDTKGQQLPIAPPSASDTLGQLLGFTPADKAEYSDKAQAVAQRKDILTREANGIKTRLIAAISTQDTDSARDLIAQAQQFDINHPTMNLMGHIMRSFQQKQTDQYEAQAFGVPLRTDPRDAGAVALTRY